MKALILVLTFAAAAAVVLVVTAHAGTFYPNKPSCRTQCVTVNGVTTCTTTCSGGYN